MPANLEHPAVATGLEKVSFHSNPKERQYQRILKLPHNCTHFTCAKHLSRLARYPPSGHPGQMGGSQAPSLATAPVHRLCLHPSWVLFRGRWGRRACILSAVVLCSIPVPGTRPSTYKALSKGWLLSAPRVPNTPRAPQDARHPSGQLVLPWCDKAQGGQTYSWSPVSTR